MNLFNDPNVAIVMFEASRLIAFDRTDWMNWDFSKLFAFHIIFTFWTAHKCYRVNFRFKIDFGEYAGAARSIEQVRKKRNEIVTMVLYARIRWGQSNILIASKRPERSTTNSQLDVQFHW